MKHAAAMLKLSGQSDPDPQKYLRHRYTDRQTDRQIFFAFIERCSNGHSHVHWVEL